MSTDDNDAYGDLDKSNLKFIYGQFLTAVEFISTAVWVYLMDTRESNPSKETGRESQVPWRVFLCSRNRAGMLEARNPMPRRNQCRFFFRKRQFWQGYLVYIDRGSFSRHPPWCR